MVQPYKPSGFPTPGPRTPAPAQRVTIQPSISHPLAKTTAGGGILRQIGASFAGAFRK